MPQIYLKEILKNCLMILRNEQAREIKTEIFNVKKANLC